MLSMFKREKLFFILILLLFIFFYVENNQGIVHEKEAIIND